MRRALGRLRASHGQRPSPLLQDHLLRHLAAPVDYSHPDVPRTSLALTKDGVHFVPQVRGRHSPPASPALFMPPVPPASLPSAQVNSVLMKHMLLVLHEAIGARAGGFQGGPCGPFGTQASRTTTATASPSASPVFMRRDPLTGEEIDVRGDSRGGAGVAADEVNADWLRAAADSQLLREQTEQSGAAFGGGALPGADSFTVVGLDSLDSDGRESSARGIAADRWRAAVSGDAGASLGIAPPLPPLQFQPGGGGGPWQQPHQLPPPQPLPPLLPPQHQLPYLTAPPVTGAGGAVLPGSGLPPPLPGLAPAAPGFQVPSGQLPVSPQYQQPAAPQPLPPLPPLAPSSQLQQQAQQLALAQQQVQLAAQQAAQLAALTVAAAVPTSTSSLSVSLSVTPAPSLSPTPSTSLPLSSSPTKSPPPSATTSAVPPPSLVALDPPGQEPPPSLAAEVDPETEEPEDAVPGAVPDAERRDDASASPARPPSAGGVRGPRSGGGLVTSARRAPVVAVIPPSWLLAVREALPASLRGYVSVSSLYASSVLSLGGFWLVFRLARSRVLRKAARSDAAAALAARRVAPWRQPPQASPVLGQEQQQPPLPVQQSQHPRRLRTHVNASDTLPSDMETRFGFNHHQGPADVRPGQQSPTSVLATAGSNRRGQYGGRAGARVTFAADAAGYASDGGGDRLPMRSPALQQPRARQEGQQQQQRWQQAADAGFDEGYASDRHGAYGREEEGDEDEREEEAGMHGGPDEEAEAGYDGATAASAAQPLFAPYPSQQLEPRYELQQQPQQSWQQQALSGRREFSQPQQQQQRQQSRGGTQGRATVDEEGGYFSSTSPRYGTPQSAPPAAGWGLLTPRGSSVAAAAPAYASESQAAPQAPAAAPVTVRDRPSYGGGGDDGAAAPLPPLSHSKRTMEVAMAVAAAALRPSGSPVAVRSSPVAEQDAAEAT